MGQQRSPLKSAKLTPRDSKFIHGIVQGKTKRQAMKDAGYRGTPGSVSVKASHTLAKPNVQEALMEAMTRAGIDVDTIAKTIRNGLTATKQEIVRKLEPTEDGSEAFTTTYEDVPDHNVRHKYLETTLKIGGMITQDAPNITNNFLLVNSSDKDLWDSL